MEGQQALSLYKDAGEAKLALIQAKGFIDEMLKQQGLGFCGVIYSLSKDNEMVFGGQCITPPAHQHRGVVANLLTQMVRDLMKPENPHDEEKKRHTILGPLIRKIFYGKPKQG